MGTRNDHPGLGRLLAALAVGVVLGWLGSQRARQEPAPAVPPVQDAPRSRPDAAGHELSGTVIDRDGEPVPGAEVRLGLESAHYRATQEMESTTDGTGRFVLAPALPGRGTLHVSKAGFLELSHGLVVPTPGGTLRVGLEREALVSGRVVVGERPAAESSVYVLRADDARTSDAWRPLGVSVASHGARRGGSFPTDRKGAFTVRGFPAGEYVLLALDEGGAFPQMLAAAAHADEPPDPVVRLSVADSGRSGLVLPLAPTGGVTGRLTLGERPLRGATAEVLQWAAPRAAWVLVNRENVGGRGRYRVGGLPDGAYVLAACPAPEAFPALAPFEVVGGEDVSWDAALTGPSLRGRVVRPGTGAPLQDAVVTARLAGPQDLFGLAAADVEAVLARIGCEQVEVSTDGRGAFELPYLPAARYVLAVEAPGRIPRTLHVAAPSQDELRIELR